MLINFYVFLLFLLRNFGTTEQAESTAIKKGLFSVDIQSRNHKWDKISSHIVQMMMKSDVTQKKNFLDVIVFYMAVPNQLWNFEGFYQLLSNNENGRISQDFFSLTGPKWNSKADFVILLMYGNNYGVESIIERNFYAIFLNKNTKFFIILHNSSDLKKLFSIWRSLAAAGYKNVYAILHQISGNFVMYRTVFVENLTTKTYSYGIQQSSDDKYLTLNSLKTGKEIRHVRIIYYDSYPSSFVRNGEIIGADGNLIREFCRKFGLNYRIMNPNGTVPSIKNIFRYLSTNTDISLYPNAFTLKNDLENAFLNEMDGSCLLIPRNIPVSTYENYTFPLDQPSSILIIVSLVLVIVVWKIISIVRGQNRSLISILFSVYELTMNFGASGLDQLTREENILIYSFVLGSFFLVSFYETIFLSFMMAEPTMRSAESLTELNDSGTIFHSYFSTRSIEAADLPIIRNELILNYIDSGTGKIIDIPEIIDENLVYVLTCKHAEMFIQSSRNYKNNQRLFDKITLMQYYQNYFIRSGFLHSEEFKDMIKKLSESGIYKFWEVESYKRIFEQQRKNENIDDSQKSVKLYEMQFPIIILLIGSLFSVIVLVGEYFVFKYSSFLHNSSENINFQSKPSEIPKKKKLKLNKWMEKYIYRRKVDTTVLSKEDKIGSQMKSYESMINKLIIMKRIKMSIVLHHDKHLAETKNTSRKEVIQKHLKCGYFVPKSWMVEKQKGTRYKDYRQSNLLSRSKFTTSNFMTRISNKRKMQPIKDRIIYVKPYRNEENNQNLDQE